MNVKRLFTYCLPHGAFVLSYESKAGPILGRNMFFVQTDGCVDTDIRFDYFYH
jgi:hypothetical protein